MPLAHVLITGGAGYIGSILSGRLLDAGYAVTVLDTFSHQQNSLAHLCYHPEFNVIRGDVRDTAVLDPTLARADIVIPLAALVGAPICDRDRLGATTINRDQVTGIAAKLSRDQRLLYPNTNSGYGIGDADSLCTEDSPLRPVSHYGRVKVEAETAVRDAGGVAFRLATVFGMSPRMRIDLLVNDFTYRAVTDRSVVLFESGFRRNFIHVRDVARAFLHGIENYAAMSGEVYNCGLSEANLTKMQLCEEIARQVPGFVILEAPIGEDPDKRDYLVSNDKLEATGFKPEFGLQAGIAELIKGYRSLTNSRFGNV